MLYDILTKAAKKGLKNLDADQVDALEQKIDEFVRNECFFYEDVSAWTAAEVVAFYNSHCV